MTINLSPHIIPLFITHEGCPHHCVFCNQNAITGEETIPVTPADVVATIEQHLRSPRKRAASEIQVAFYGGSFTGLKRGRQSELLDAVKPFLASNRVHAVRISTRPDYISPDVAQFLKIRGVTIVELGVQSLDDRVLHKSGRGHSSKDVVRAFRSLREEGLMIGAQLMLGLPGDSTPTFLGTVKLLIALQPDFVRLHPALVLRDSTLASMYDSGIYSPLALEKAVSLCAKAKELFDEAAIPVVRMGLQATEGLAQSVVAGPFHPAFGEKVLSRIYFRRLRQLLINNRGEMKTLLLSKQDESIIRGPKNHNLQRLARKGLLNRTELLFQPQITRSMACILRPGTGSPDSGETINLFRQ